ncbi:acyltransferase [Bradyrhizobium sp.]|uniref:acyltransferase family protein n=1 Tax=Bradyrhizobium sp. TaxID=376 RepID=UPI002733386C|nr:acyltransferase [Bradyrhizobium sp.]MDP3691884.1 acyltransferase [Bradyrhizobium sp.]
MGAIRLFLALVVAVGHLRMLMLTPAGINTLPNIELGINAGFAVMFFYMISGFLISTGLTEKYPSTPAGALRFYEGRLVRIFSLYWPVLLLTFAVHNLWSWFGALSSIDKFTNVFIIGVDWRILFADYPGWHWDASPQYLHQAWTLGAELVFYLLAPFILRSWKVAMSLLLLSAAIRLAIVSTTPFDGRMMYLFLPSTLVFFLIGHFVQLLSLRWLWIRSGRIGLLFLACSWLWLRDGTATWDGFRFWAAVICFAAALPGIFSSTKDSARWNALGDLSYPVYLLHIVVMVKLMDFKLLERLPYPPLLITAVYLAVVIVSAIAVHWLLERPTAALMRSCFRLFRRTRTRLFPVKPPAVDAPSAT